MDPGMDRKGEEDAGATPKGEPRNSADPERSAGPPQILQYLDYRDFLRDFYAHRKIVDKDFSQRHFARDAGLPATCSSLLPAIIKGRRQLSQNLRVKFGKALKLADRDNRYFDLLVQFNQAKSMTEKNTFFAQLAKFRSSRAQIVGETQYRFFSKWYYSAVWNYFGIDQKQRHPGVIAANILPPITPTQAEEAVKLLLELGLIKKTASGYAVAERHIYTEKNVQAMAARQHIQELGGMAMAVFPTLPAEQRQYNALMFSISQDGFQAIKDRIRSFQEELREIIDRDSKEDRVYTLTMQLFPNSKVPG
ncbi:MAG: TIGR02147 family protein [Fibrobacteria bacterium]